MFSAQKASLIILFYVLFSLLSWISYTERVDEVHLQKPFRFYLKKPGWVGVRGEYVSETEKDTYLVLRLVDANGIEVRVNGEVKLRIGGDGVAAKLWRATMPVKVHLREGKNEFLFKLWGVYSISLDPSPFISDDPWLYVFLMNFIHTWLPMFLAPALFLIAIFTLRFEMIVREDVVSSGFFVAMLFSTSLFLTYYATIPNYAEPKIYFGFLNKIAAISTILMVVFYHAAFERLLKRSEENGVFLYKFTVPLTLIFSGILSVLKYEISRNFAIYTLPFLAVFLLIHALILSIKNRSRFTLAIFIFLASVFQYIIGISIGKFSVIPVVISLIVTVFEAIDEKIEIYLANMRLANLSKIDHLTGAFNRKILNELSLSKGDIIAFVDINDFKKLNDTKGHDYGDMVLRTFSEVAKNNIKGKDFLVRYGGDEFLIFLKDCSLKDANEILERISEEFRKRTSCDISYGLVKYDGNLEKAISEADKKMYEMKRRMKGGGGSD